MPADDGILSVELYHPTAAEEIAHQGLYQKWHGHRELQLVCAGKQWMNFTPINADKGIALSEYQNMHGISPQETMAFGDGENDIPMLVKAGVGVAVANAKDNVKAAADYIAPSVDEDGVAEALRHFSVIA